MTVARRVIRFLEDQRVLYNPSELEQPDHCVQSVLDIRRFLTAELAAKYHPDVDGDLPPSSLAILIRALIRGSTIRVLGG